MQFRPLNPVLKKRWINVHELSEDLGWEPITVHKIGDLYFVEDGHHRVSVARHSGWDTIEAQVYEQPLPAHSGIMKCSGMMRCSGKSRALPGAAR